MRKLNLDFTSVDTFDPVPPGDYPVTISKIEIRVSESNPDGDPYLNWELQIASGEHQGRRLWYMTSTAPRALWKLKETLKALGIEGETLDLEWNDENEVTSPALKGFDCIASVIQEQYQGRMQNRVNSLEAVGGKTPSQSARGPQLR